MIRKVKTSAKMFVSDSNKLQQLVVSTMAKISDIVGSSMGPGGKITLIESDYPGLPNKSTKDGVTIFESLGSNNSYEHLIIEQARDAAKRTASEAGDGTTTCTVLSAELVKNLYRFCKENPKYSPQKVARELRKLSETVLVPAIRERAIKIDESNIGLLKMVAKVSANGDEEMADAVIKSFDLLGYGENSHVTIKEVPGPHGYEVGVIEGFPVPVGYEESAGKFHQAFINDQANQRCVLEKPLFLLYDGNLNSLVTIQNILDDVGNAFASGNSDYKNMVVVAHGFSDEVLTQLAFNFANPLTINIVPMITPMAGFLNSQLHFLHDLSAFTGAAVFGMSNQVADATIDHLGKNAESFESYRFRSTVIAHPNADDIELRVSDLKTQKQNAESALERSWLEERLGKLTSGIAKLTIYGASGGELKEAHDRCEDAVCAVRAAISKGALPGGCRIAIDLAQICAGLNNRIAEDVLIPALMSLPARLLDNAGHNSEEIESVVDTLLASTDSVYDVENQKFGRAEDLGIFDALPAVEEAIKNAIGIAGVMGTMGGIVAYPRDEQFERSEASADREFERAVNDPHSFKNEANERP